MARTKRIWRLIIAACLVCTAAFGAARLPREALLLVHANEVADVTGWWPPDAMLADYQWVSDTVLLTGTGDWRLESPFLYDIHSHKKTLLSPLDKHLKQDSDMGTNDWKLSPDRQWLLWTMELYDDVRTARLDGSGFQVVPLPLPGDTIGNIGWKNDSRHWLAEGYAYNSRQVTNVFEGEVRNGGRSRSLPISEGIAFFDSDAPQANAEGKFVAIRQAAGETSAHAGSKWVTLYPPKDTHIAAIVQSGRGDRLAWVLLSTREPPFVRWLRRVFLHLAPPSTAAQLWFSRADGREMHEAGYIVLKGSIDDAELPHDLRWLPSEKSLSFVCKNALWTIPAE